MKKWTTKDLTLYGILMAMTIVATMLIQIPTIATKGYVNVGDAVVLLAGLVLGRRGGFVVGGFGSALADILLGYTWYAPITLLVKGVEGYLAGSIFSHTENTKPFLATLPAGIWMAVGYLFAEIFMYSFPAAVASFPGNLLQGGVGAFLAVLLYYGVRRWVPHTES